MTFFAFEQDRMKRYEEIGDFWKNRGAGKRDAEIEAREEQQTLEAARRRASVSKGGNRKRRD